MRRLKIPFIYRVAILSFLLLIAGAACGIDEVLEVDETPISANPSLVATAQARAIAEAEESRRDLPLRMEIAEGAGNAEVGVALNSHKGSVFVNGRRMPQPSTFGGNIFVVWVGTERGGTIEYENGGALIADISRIATLWTYTTFDTVKAIYVTAEEHALVENPSVAIEDAPLWLILSRPILMRPARIFQLQPTELGGDVNTVVRIGANGGVSITFAGLKQPREYGDKFLLLWVLDTLSDEPITYNGSWLTVTPNGDSQIVMPSPPETKGMRQYNRLLITAENLTDVRSPNSRLVIFTLDSETPFWETL
jgi:hypothetical protein